MNETGPDRPLRVDRFGCVWWPRGDAWTYRSLRGVFLAKLEADCGPTTEYVPAARVAALEAQLAAAAARVDYAEQDAHAARVDQIAEAGRAAELRDTLANGMVCQTCGTDYAPDVLHNGPISDIAGSGVAHNDNSQDVSACRWDMGPLGPCDRPKVPGWETCADHGVGAPPPTTAVDLMAALKASLERAKAARTATATAGGEA
jgi:hypothetical protein